MYNETNQTVPQAAVLLLQQNGAGSDQRLAAWLPIRDLRLDSKGRTLVPGIATKARPVSRMMQPITSFRCLIMII